MPSAVAVERRRCSRSLTFHCNSHFLSNFYDFCTTGNWNEHCTVYILNGLMMSQLHHIACNKISFHGVTLQNSTCWRQYFDWKPDIFCQKSNLQFPNMHQLEKRNIESLCAKAVSNHFDQEHSRKLLATVTSNCRWQCSSRILVMCSVMQL